MSALQRTAHCDIFAQIFRSTVLESTMARFRALLLAILALAFYAQAQPGVGPACAVRLDVSLRHQT